MSSKATPKPDNPPSPLRFQFLTIRDHADYLENLQRSVTRKRVVRLDGEFRLW